MSEKIIDMAGWQDQELLLLIKEHRKEVRPAELWQRIMENRLTDSDRYLLAIAVKRLAKDKHINTGIIVFTEKAYWDLDSKTPDEF